MRELTRRQQEVLEFIESFIADKSFPPSVRDITRHFQLASAAGAHKHIKALVKKGYLTKEEFLSRSLRVSRPSAGERPVHGPGEVEIPLLGQVAAGQPIEALPQQERLAVAYSMVQRSPGSYALKVKGDSMVDEGILDGDYVIMEPRVTAENGEVVVALLNGGDVTLKRFFREDNHIRLQPANASMEPIIVTDTDIKIQGVVIGMWRNLRPSRKTR